jgi:hypothetical protein
MQAHRASGPLAVRGAGPRDTIEAVGTQAEVVEARSVLVELPAVVPPLTHLRGTTMAASLTVLEEQGIAPSLWQVLAPEHHAALRGMLAASWVELELGLAYYGALDALGLAEAQIRAIGRAAALRMQSTFVNTLIRGMGTVTPATVLSRMDKLWARSFRGGAVRVVQTSPKDIELEIHGAAFLELRYTRIALMGYYEQTLVATTRRLFMTELPRPAPGAGAWQLSWV